MDSDNRKYLGYQANIIKLVNIIGLLALSILTLIWALTEHKHQLALAVITFGITFLGIRLVLINFKSHSSFFSKLKSLTIIMMCVVNLLVLIENTSQLLDVVILISFNLWIVLSAQFINSFLSSIFERIIKYTEEIQQFNLTLENKVIERTEALEKAHTEKIIQLNNMANVGRISAGLVHDLNSPIAAIQASIDLIEIEEHPNSFNKYLHRANSSLAQIAKLLQSIRKQLLGETTERTFNIKEEIQAIVEVFDYQFKKNNIKLITDIDPQLFLRGNDATWAQVTFNLLANAIDAVSATSSKQIRIQAEKSLSEIKVTFMDTGSGLDSEQWEMNLQEFNSSKSDHLGLGLAICHKLLERDFDATLELIPASGAFHTAIQVTIPN